LELRVFSATISGRSTRSPEEISLHTEAGGSAPPDAFGPFRVLHQIGAGALGPVFRAYDPDQDKLVAVKLFRVDLPPERVHELVADFERLIAADLTHSSIVAAVATGIVQVSPYLAQDFVAADSLDTVLREHGPAPAGEGLRIVTQIAGGLDYAAVVGIVHGALHPRDVLISPDDVRLTGIGVARALERVGVQVPVRRPYAAPERVEGGAWDRRADVFTLAALAHELLWGRRITAIGAEAAAGLDELPGAHLNRLRDAFARALAENPAQRFPTALEFADALKNCFTERQETRAFPARQAPDYPGLPINDVLAKSSSASMPAAAPLLPLVPEEKAPEKAPEQQVEEPRIEAPQAAKQVVEPEQYIDQKVAEQTVEPIKDLTLRGSEPSLSRDEEPARSDAEPPARVAPPVRVDRVEHPINLVPPESLSPARSAVWPLSLALLVGLALGFAGGYWLGQSDQRREQMSASADRPTIAETEVPLKTEPAPPAAAPPPVTAPPSTAPPVAEPPATVPPATARPEAAPPAAKPPPARPAAPPPVAEDSKPAETATVARTGRITVRTTPAGARVTIDGKEVGKSPLTIPNLARGTHTVRVIRDGYSTVERRVVITPSQPASTLTLNLARATAPSAARPPAPSESGSPLTASLTIESRPSGATVFVDGKRVGTTPLAIPGLSVGAHAVRMEMAGYKPWSASVRVVAGEKNRVAASLEQ
jgi:eukaryotic-like serine/threonine-protein kinase